MQKIKDALPGLLLCFAIALCSWFLGQWLPVVGGPVFAILAGMLVSLLFKRYSGFGILKPGIAFCAKKVLQCAVVLLGFGMNLSVVLKTGARSLPIILSTICVALLIAYALYKALKLPAKTATLIGVGSAICGGSAIAATAPVIGADDEEVAQAVSVIFFFNVLAALLFPSLGMALGFDGASPEAFGIFAGTAINDTSSVTAAASTWDSLHALGSATLDQAITVKLTRTLAIIPITLVLAFARARKTGGEGKGVSIRKIFPFFILWFVLASLLTTIATSLGAAESLFSPFKTLSKFFIAMAMAAIGLNTDIVKLFKTGAKPLLLGLCCWVGIAASSLLMQKLLGIW